MFDELKRRYSFLKDDEVKLLYLLSKSHIKHDNIKKLGNKKFNLYINRYLKKVKKLNQNSNVNNDVIISNYDVDTLFYIKKNKINVKKLIKKLSCINNMNVFLYPDNEKIISYTKKRFAIEKAFNLFIMFISLIYLGTGIFNLNTWNKENNKIKKIEASVEKTIKVEEQKIDKDSFINKEDYDLYKDIRNIKVDFNKLTNQNSDTKGWVNLLGTTVNYPFVQSSDNDYYLEHDFNKNKNKKGWVFLDYRNDINNLSFNNILYAHGLINEKMFGGMRNVFKKEWQDNKNNHIIRLSTANSKQLWEVFSIYKTKPEEYYITTDFEDDNEYKLFIDTISKRSEYNFNTSVNTTDKILTLSSCYSKGVRMVVHAKLISYEEN